MQENVNKDCRYIAVFLISRNNNFILLLSCFGLIFTRPLTLPSLRCRSARVESNTESGIFTNTLHSK